MARPAVGDIVVPVRTANGKDVHRVIGEITADNLPAVQGPCGPGRRPLGSVKVKVDTVKTGVQGGKDVYKPLTCFTRGHGLTR